MREYVNLHSIPGFQGKYFVSQDGRVYSSSTDTWLKPLNNGHGYMQVRLWDNDKRRYFFRYIHRLVAQAFIPNPDNKPQVNHKDFNRANNESSNLEWVTRKENVQWSWKAGHGVEHLKQVQKKSWRKKRTKKQMENLKKAQRASIEKEVWKIANEATKVRGELFRNGKSYGVFNSVKEAGLFCIAQGWYKVNPKYAKSLLRKNTHRELEYRRVK